METTKRPKKWIGIFVIFSFSVLIFAGIVSTCDGSEETQTQMTRKDSLNKLFNGDGSCTSFAIELKNRLNDPDSYQHVETFYRDLKDPMAFHAFKMEHIDFCNETEFDTTMNYIAIETKFRAKNAFNATILNSAWGIVDMPTGKVLYIEIE